MNWVFLIVGGVLALVGVGALWWRHTVGQQMALMASMQTTPAAEIGKLPSGTFVEVKGTLRVREPLAAEFSQRPAAYFRAEIQREETYYERDSKGQSQRKTRTTTVYNNLKYGACLIEDATGRVGIDFDGAEVEAEQTVNEHVANPSALTGLAGAANAMFDMMTGHNVSFRRVEHLLKPDIPVYVLASVREGGLLGKPMEGAKEKTFVVSNKSEEERTKSLKWTRLWLLLGAIAFLGIGLVLLAIAIGSRS